MLKPTLFKILLFLSCSPEQLNELELIAKENYVTVEEIISFVVQDSLDTDMCIEVQRVEDTDGR